MSGPKKRKMNDEREAQLPPEVLNGWYRNFTEPFKLVGDLIPHASWGGISWSKHGDKYAISNTTAEITFDRQPTVYVAQRVRVAVAKMTAVLDAYTLISGLPSQVIFTHPDLRRGEGEVVTSSRAPMGLLDDFRKLDAAYQLSKVADYFRPIGLAMRDFRIALILPPEDGAACLWRALEWLLWAEAAEGATKAEDMRNIDALANKVQVEKQKIIDIKSALNNDNHMARHATNHYKQRHDWLKKVYKRMDSVPLFLDPIADGDRFMVDVHPISFPIEEWYKFLNTVREIIRNYASSIAANPGARVLILFS